MKIAVFGTGSVGQALAGRLEELKHQVVIGTRDPAATLAKTEKDAMGTPPLREWHGSHKDVKVETFKNAAQHGEIIVNATNGRGAIEALKMAGDAAVNGKVMIDISNPLDFSKGMPPSLFVSNTDSLAEQLQKAFPALKVVKALNMVNATLMVYPEKLAGGDHTMFVAGNDAGAKTQVTDLLKTFGWKDILDLGDITSARGMEMYLPLWLRMWGAVKTPMFSIKVVK